MNHLAKADDKFEQIARELRQALADDPRWEVSVEPKTPLQEDYETPIEYTRAVMLTKGCISYAVVPAEAEAVRVYEAFEGMHVFMPEGEQTDFDTLKAFIEYIKALSDEVFFGYDD